MKKILITGGTVFVSRNVATYFVNRGDDVTVLNRGNHPQVHGVSFLKGDRHNLSDLLKNYEFDVIVDVCAYTRQDVESLLAAVSSVKQYIFISSGAVYPETLPLPFNETQICSYNSIWKDYASNKWEAEEYIKEHVKNYYLIRPPYLYGPMQNLYREAFVFDCARKDMPFYIPKNGSMQLHFFYIDDLCRFIEILMDKQPEERIFNVGNPETVDIKEWTTFCYQTVGKAITYRNVNHSHDLRSYFPFYDYEYILDVTRQSLLMPETTPLEEGLKNSFQWYLAHEDEVMKKPFFEYINHHLMTE